MNYKKYCFIPEKTKIIGVFNSNNPSLKNYEAVNDIVFLRDTAPDIEFSISLDEKDKAIIFYVDGDNNITGMSDEDYFRYKTLNAIKVLFSENEIMGFNLTIGENSHFSFTVVYDPDGNPISRNKLKDENKKKTLISHTYTYGFYKKYEK